MPLHEDLELLHALQIAPRASWRSIGAAIHRSPGVLATRWQELTDAGLAWSTAVPFGSERSGVLVFVALLSESGRQSELIDQAMSIPEVISVEEPARHWDLILTVLARSFEDFLQRLRPGILRLEGIARHETIVCTRLHFSGHEWRLNALSEEAARALARQNPAREGSSRALREEDRELLSILFRDGRAGVSEISAELGTHPSTVSRRLNRVLANSGVSLRCDVAPEIIGQPISCQWFCWLPPEQHAAAALILRALPNLRLCASTTGQTNFTFVIWVEAPEDIFEIERTVVERIDNLSISESSVTVRFLKRMGWRLDSRGRRSGDPVAPTFFP